MALVAAPARNAANHSRGPGGVTSVATRWKIVRATTAARANWAMLNALLTHDWLRSAKSAMPVPSMIASRYSFGGRKNSPRMPGSSLSENECRSRRKWTSTTLVSPR